MVRLLDLMHAEHLLRACTDLGMRCLLTHISGRVFEPQSEQVGFVRVPTTGKARGASRRECARALGLSEDRFKRELTKARAAVLRAFTEQRAA